MPFVIFAKLTMESFCHLLGPLIQLSSLTKILNMVFLLKPQAVLGTMTINNITLSVYFVIFVYLLWLLNNKVEIEANVLSTASKCFYD